jgi:GNAT superfamily N-acetyltransferase
MTTTKQKLSHRKWTKDDYFISTDPALIPIAELNTVFASEYFYWADALPEDVMRETLNNSLCFGVYEAPPSVSNCPGEAANGTPSQPRLTGFARCITDFTTFLYLTDVYIDPKVQGKGLGAWLIKCVQEVIEEMPHLRRSMLFTSSWEKSVPFYEKLMGMSVLECKKPAEGEKGESVAIMQMRGPAFPSSLR